MSNTNPKDWWKRFVTYANAPVHYYPPLRKATNYDLMPIEDKLRDLEKRVQALEKKTGNV